MVIIAELSVHFSWLLRCWCFKYTLKRRIIINKVRNKVIFFKVVDSSGNFFLSPPAFLAQFSMLLIFGNGFPV